MDKPIPIIHDGDHGGDDLVTSLLALHRQDVLNVLGITTTFGNVGLETTTKNACRAVDFNPGQDVPVIPGADAPWKTPSRRGDNAFGFNGLGGVDLGSAQTKAASLHAVEWLEQTLESAEEPITLCPTGPFTNIAMLLNKRPDLSSKIRSIIGMGGCFRPQPPHGRQGNITPVAEFNFYMDAAAADYVLKCGVPTVLFPLDATHQLVFTKSRQEKAREALGPGMGEKFIQIMGAAADIDKSHFDLGGGVFHDECIILYLIDPTLFEGQSYKLEVVTDEDSEAYGKLVESKDPSRPDILLIETITDSDRAFAIILDTLKAILGR